MATWDYSKQNAAVPGLTQISTSGTGDHKIMRSRVDLALAPDTVAAADTVKFMVIPAGFSLRAAWLKVESPSTSTTRTAGMVDSGGTGVISAASKDLKAAAGTTYTCHDGTAFWTATEGIITTGKVYATADWLGLLLAGSGANNSGVFTITADLIKI